MPRSFIYDSMMTFWPWGLLVLSALGAGGDLSPHEAKDAERDASIRLSAQPIEEVSILGEPVWVRLHFENEGHEAVSIDLGTSDVDRLAVIWRPLEGGGDLVEQQGGVLPGLTFPHVVAIPPGGAATHTFLLNKLIVPDRAGRFELRVRIRETGLPEATTTIRLQPPLGDRLKHWFDLAADPRTGHGERTRALEDLVYTRSPAAVPYQAKLLAGQLLTLEEINVCLASMLAGDPDEASKRLVQHLERKEGNASLRNAILYALKSYGWQRLSAASVRLLEPYKAEIMLAAPIDVGD